MRKIFSPAILRAGRYGLEETSRLRNHRPFLLGLSQSRSLAQVRSDRELLSESWVTPSGPQGQQLDDPLGKQQDAPPDERTLKLGKSKRPQPSCAPLLTQRSSTGSSNASTDPPYIALTSRDPFTSH